ncbi:PTS system, lactose cellobiose IIC component family protein [Companilactobacillus paralimentarius DSM 13238 = JCM 10415]|jgi:PTS system, lactose/cellobiose family IIC component|uniref:Permease IIC component n=1 Tax=Companilactobacillus paralimentarius DSM 13238 = JCM 10415 TaxID=1122151 RepID=A0A0R1PMP3_9LACO|nr:PTS transporter subunit EIIC [Companilactobacillus paralimentarius]KAE9564544.1 hypothetical protein ATN96_08275 [Companilactobacillus paralimentarius]KRL31205.1 PTS system, lactose cellobiose IIC component family protein [Companilactobacillus paralimentarius DSM 13238 = JCM 10415]MDR4933642.1 PTS transporter subunit EIIC [Companilactobacillus paralimentarius]
MKNGFSEFLNKKIMPFANKLAANKALMAIRDGVGFAITLIIIGSVPLIINSLPFDNWTQTLQGIKIPYFDNLSNLLNMMTNMTFGIMVIPTVFGIAYSFTKSHIHDELKSIGSGFVALGSYLTITPVITNKAGQTGVDLTYLGSKGLIVAIILGLISAKIFSMFIEHNVEIKMPESVPPAISKTFSALLPGFVIIFMWILIAIIIGMFGFNNIHEVILKLLNKPLSFLGGTLAGTLIAVGLNSLVWSIGVHGTVINSAMNPIWLMNSDANRLALQHGKEVPNIVTNSFMDNFTYMGGSGATACLILALFILVLMKKASAESKAITSVGTAPAIFNINEPVMFGYPVVFNVAIIIPFILVPMVFATTTYLSMKWGLVAKPTGTVLNWTMPPIISGYLATNSISGAVIQVINLVIGTLIYLPFVASINNKQVLTEKLDEEKA